MNHKKEVKQVLPHYDFFLKNRKGVSGVVTVVILVALVMTSVAIVWTVVNNMVEDKLGEAESCFGNFEKITLNNRYTCYNSSSNETMFSINVGDIVVDEVIVLVYEGGATNSYTITDTITTIPNLENYTGGTSIILPDKNAGLTYIAKDYTSSPDYIEIVPVLNGKQCDVADRIPKIESCS
ncbi:hypothetical protein GOV13_05325 [Candidatus Pacearchaeota archaeon]|nr:hypothetical protein [Candidatus Pacearchaeota archaeon]